MSELNGTTIKELPHNDLLKLREAARQRVFGENAPVDIKTFEQLYSLNAETLLRLIMTHRDQPVSSELSTLTRWRKAMEGSTVDKAELCAFEADNAEATSKIFTPEFLKDPKLVKEITRTAEVFRRYQLAYLTT